MARSKTTHAGFTLIEVMVAIVIFAIIAAISYRTIASLATTKLVVTNSQTKWSGIANAINKISTAWNRAIPLAIRDENGLLLPAVLGKAKLDNNFDAQVEFTYSGFIGDNVYGASPPKRVGFRYIGGDLFLVTWPYLNRVPHMQPQVELILSNIADFKISFLYTDKQWRDTWPMDNFNFTKLPYGLQVYIKMQSGEEITRIWAL